MTADISISQRLLNRKIILTRPSSQITAYPKVSESGPSPKQTDGSHLAKTLGVLIGYGTLKYLTNMYSSSFMKCKLTFIQII